MATQPLRLKGVHYSPADRLDLLPELWRSFGATVLGTVGPVAKTAVDGLLKMTVAG